MTWYFGTTEGAPRLKNWILLSLIFASIASEETSANFTRVYGKYLQENAVQKGPEIKSAPSVRVLVQKSRKDVSISGLDLKRKFHLSNRTKHFAGRKKIKFKCSELRSADFNKPVLLASLGSSAGLLTLNNDEKFNGLIHVVSSRDSESCDVVHETDMDTYIAGLLAKEMNSKWPIEALKAQAVAARSYALHKMQSGQVRKEAGFETFYDLESSEKHQVAGNFFDVNPKTRSAALATSGQVLVNSRSKIAPVFFHAKCGGQTLRPSHVWQNKVDSYTSVKCPFCENHGQRAYNSKLTLSKIKKFIYWAKRKGHLPASIKEHMSKPFRLVRDKKFNRKIHFYLGSHNYSFKKTLLRRYFGRFIVPSNNFEMKVIRKNKSAYFQIDGAGLGHGVGMCQLGALDLAQRGWDYKRILSYYFPGHTLSKVY